MKNIDVINYIIDKGKSTDFKTYISELCTNELYGQNCGGFYKNKNRENDDLTQKNHFISYYISRKDEEPSYSRLFCPQLLLFIAELAGLNQQKLDNGYKHIKDFEHSHKIVGKEKNAKYMCKDRALTELKSILNIYDIEKIIKFAANWDEVVKEVNKLN